MADTSLRIEADNNVVDEVDSHPDTEVDEKGPAASEVNTDEQAVLERELQEPAASVVEESAQDAEVGEVDADNENNSASEAEPVVEETQKERSITPTCCPGLMRTHHTNDLCDVVIIVFPRSLLTISFSDPELAVKAIDGEDQSEDPLPEQSER
jgi:hypothetical protein